VDGSGMPLPDLQCGLLHQKLQMLNLCIARQQDRRVKRSPPRPQVTPVGVRCNACEFSGYGSVDKIGLEMNGIIWRGCACSRASS